MANGIHYCAVLAAVLLVLVAITGPIYAFFFMSCVTMRSCRFGTRLHSIGATCSEGSAYAEQMLHGEACTLVCAPGFAPTQPAIACNDGYVEGLDVVQCRPVIIRDTRPSEGGLVSGAVTGGEKHTACQRAQNLQCDARPGGSSILLQLSGFTKPECDALLAECQGFNSRFHWGQHREDSNGTCTLGCFAELLSPEDAQAALDRAAAALAAQQSIEGVFPATNNPLGELRPTCSAGPTCVNVAGSCNADDNGDYYRHPLCASGMSQWVQADASHRIRYDGKPQYAQGGKWILEIDADPTTDNYGTQLARQPVYNELPRYGFSVWDFSCRTRINSFTYAVDFRKVELTLGSCTCTSAQDCSGNGQAVGSKLLGPNCRCICNDGWDGPHCDIQLCKVPDVLHAAVPACAEGSWLSPNQRCTPLCNPGYAPSSASFLCENGRINPAAFRCTPQSALGTPGASDGVSEEPTLAPRPVGPCSRADCFFRGTTIGGRQRDGSCICQCDAGYGGHDCRTIVGTCQAPLQKTILNSAMSACREGSEVPTICTAECEEGYYPMPATLSCTGQILVPQTFRCFGGPTTRETWCKSMRYIAISASSIAVVALLAGCCLFGRPFRKEPRNFFAATQVVEIEKDEEGAYNVVRPSGVDVRSKMPSHIVNAVRADVIFEPMDEPSPTGKMALQDGYHPSKQPSHLRQLADPREAPPPGDHLALAVDLPGDVAEGERSESLNGKPTPPPVPRLREGYEVLVHAIDDLPLPLNGAKGQLVAQEPASGTWIVALEGREGVQRLPEESLVVAAPPPAPAGEPGTAHQQWLLEVYELEGKSQAMKKAQEAQFASLKQQEEAQREASIAEALEATATERAEVEDKLRDGLRLGNIEMVRDAVQRARVLIEKTKGAKASILNGLVRALQVAESRLEQYDEREDARQRKREYDERVRTGLAADWKMTPAEFWRFAEDGNVERVRAGLKAKLPIFTRSQDGLRRSVVHVACQRACVGDEDAGSQHVEVVRELLAARAHANGVDFDGRTPLDLALSEAAESEAAKAPGIAETLRELGLRTAEEAAAEARATPAGSSPVSRTTSNAGSPVRPARAAAQVGRSPMVMSARRAR